MVVMWVITLVCDWGALGREHTQMYMWDKQSKLCFVFQILYIALSLDWDKSTLYSK